MSKRNSLIDEILAKSEALVNTQGRNDGISHIKRGIGELEESAKRSDLKLHDFSGGDAKAYRLLNQNANIDAENLTKQIISMDFKVHSEPLQALEGTDIEGYLAHHHDMIFLSVIDEARKKTEKDVRSTQMRWEKEEWEESRKDFMDSLGHRSQAWEATAYSSSTPSRHAAIAGVGAGAGADHSSMELSTLAILPAPAASLVQPLAASWFGGSSSSSAAPVSKPFSLGDKDPAQKACERAEALQPLLLREHALATRTLHTIDQSEQRDSGISINAMPTPCRDFLAALPSTSSGALKPFDIGGENDLKGYQFLLKLIAAMTGEGQGPPGRNKPGYFSPVVADQSSTRELHERRELLSTGAREHLEDDFRDNVIRPESAAYLRNVGGHGKLYGRMSGLEGTPDFGQEDSSLKEEVQRYVSAIMPPPRQASYGYNVECDEDGVLFWPQVYFCIRGGALALARDLLKRDDVNHNYCCAIEGLLQLAGHSSRLSPGDILSYIVKCKVEYNEAVNSESGHYQGGAPDSEDSIYDLQYQYKLQVLNLLGFVNLDALCSGEHLADTTIQDFLWVNLWFRHWSHALEEQIPSRKGAVMPTVVNESDIFYRVMEAGGADDFDPHGSLAFEFAMILCCCHQFGGAVEHLYQHGKIFPAVHLLVSCLHYGLVLPHLLLAMPMQGARSSSTPRDLLQTWVHSSKAPLTITQKVDYLVALDSGWVNNNPKRTDTQSYKSDEVRTEVLTRLLCEASDAEVALLAAGPREGGAQTESGGYLRTYLSEGRMSQLLVQAAAHLSSTGPSALLPRVILFYELAGSFVEVLEELTGQLARVLVPPSHSTSQHRERDYWLQFSADFNDKHFSGGDNLGTVLRTLGAQGRGDLVHVLQLLLKLAHLVKLHQAKRFLEAKNFMATLRILPSNQEEKAVKVQEFLNFEGPIRHVMDDILIIYMECIFEIYQEKRRDSPHFSQHQKVFQDLRHDAGLAISFGGQVQQRLNRADTVSILTDYQNRMTSDGN